MVEPHTGSAELTQTGMTPVQAQDLAYTMMLAVDATLAPGDLDIECEPDRTFCRGIAFLPAETRLDDVRQNLNDTENHVQYDGVRIDLASISSSDEGLQVEFWMQAER